MKSRSKPKVAATKSTSASKATKGGKASGPSRSKRSVSSSKARPKAKPALGSSVVSNVRKQNLHPKKPILAFVLSVKESETSHAWTKRHKSICEQKDSVLGWVFTPNRGGMFATVQCSCGAECNLASGLSAIPRKHIGKTFVQHDFSGLEIRIAAELEQEKNNPFAAFSARAAAKKSGASRSERASK